MPKPIILRMNEKTIAYCMAFMASQSACDRGLLRYDRHYKRLPRKHIERILDTLNLCGEERSTLMFSLEKSGGLQWPAVAAFHDVCRRTRCTWRFNIELLTYGHTIN